MRVCRSMGSGVARQVERSDCCQTHGFWFGADKVEHLPLHGGWECGEVKATKVGILYKGSAHEKRVWQDDLDIPCTWARCDAQC